jgi:diphthamide biosynthesis protein 7
MHAGTRVVELLKTTDGEYRLQVLGRFEEHKSMNYGSDFQPAWREKLAVVSTSFYDKLLCLWEFDMV